MSNNGTQRLYFDDPHHLEFDATVAAHAELNGAPALVLDCTAFYPEGGGQLADHGRINDMSIRDVQSDENGRVLHMLDGTLPQVGQSVRGVVDAVRRREQMSLHSAQHLLSQALFVHASAETVSARLGEHGGSIDTDKKSIADDAIAAASAAVNALIDTDAAVIARVVKPDALADLPLRAPPKVSGEVRVVFAGDYDVTPCGGTHVTRTSQIGLVHITHTERVKGKVRVHFVAGAPARTYLAHADQILRQLSADLTCGRDAVQDVFAKQRTQIKAQQQTLGQLWSALATQRAQVLCAENAGPLVLVETGRDDAYLRALNAAMTRAGRACALVHQNGDSCDLLLTSPDAGVLDCKTLLSALCESLDGKGGGKAQSARGRFGSPAPTVAAAAAEALGCPVITEAGSETT